MSTELDYYRPQFRINERPVKVHLPKAAKDLFVVYARGDGCIPLSCYAFAEDKENAITRVRSAIIELLIAAQKRFRKDGSNLNTDNLKRIERLASCPLSATLCDKQDILTAGQVWADNEGYYA